jgi:hypothetical protein
MGLPPLQCSRLTGPINASAPLFDAFGRFLSSFIRHDIHCEISCQNIYKGFGRLAALQKKETRCFQSGLFFQGVGFDMFLMIDMHHDR